MNIFDEDKKVYEITGHAKTRLAERCRVPYNKAGERCMELINEGKLLLETEKYRYIRNRNLFFPLVKEGNTYILTTVLLFDKMVENRFQTIYDNYHTKH